MSKNVFGDSALNGAVGIVSSNPYAPVPGNTRLNIELVPAPEMPGTMKRRLERLEKERQALDEPPRNEPAHAPAPPVAFDLAGAPQGLGIRMHDIMRAGKDIARWMRDPYAPVYEGAGVRAIYLRVRWPAYPLVKFVRKIDPFEEPRPGYKQRRRITRLELALMVTRHFEEFVQLVEQEMPDPAQRKWAFGGGGLAFEDLFLVALRNPTGNVFEAGIQAIL